MQKYSKLEVHRTTEHLTGPSCTNIFNTSCKVISEFYLKTQKQEGRDTTDHIEHVEIQQTGRHFFVKLPALCFVPEASILLSARRHVAPRQRNRMSTTGAAIQSMLRPIEDQTTIPQRMQRSSARPDSETACQHAIRTSPEHDCEHSSDGFELPGSTCPQLVSHLLSLIFPDADAP